MHGCDAVIAERIVREDEGGAVDAGEAKSGGEAGGAGVEDEDVVDFGFGTCGGGVGWTLNCCYCGC